VTSRPALPAEAFEHGDVRRYRRGCRCEPCKEGLRAASRYSRYLCETGRSQLTTPERAARHITRLRNANVSDQDTAKEAGVSPEIIYRIMRGEGLIRRSTERRILAARPEASPRGAGNYTPALGTVRRLRALAADGWTARALAERCGKHKQFIIHLQNLDETSLIRAFVADYVHRLYQETAGLPPEKAGIKPHLAKGTRNKAQAKGWLGTTWWDVDDLDDPDFAPAVEDTAAVMKDDVTHLLRYGVTNEEVRARTGASIAYVREIAAELRTGKPRDRKRVTTAA
jgi:hypothetical protein